MPMRCRAFIAGWRLSLLLLLAAQAGCSWLGLRRDIAQDAADPRASRADPADQRASPGGHRSR